MLAPEFIAIQPPSAQSRPQSAFRVGQGSPQLASLAIGDGAEDSKKPLTLPKLCFGPLPLPLCGRGAPAVTL
jgi:hypothetical protein